MRQLTSQTPNNTNRQPKSGPFAWVRRFGVFRHQSGSHEKKPRHLAPNFYSRRFSHTPDLAPADSAPSETQNRIGSSQSRSARRNTHSVLQHQPQDQQQQQQQQQQPQQQQQHSSSYHTAPHHQQQHQHPLSHTHHRQSDRPSSDNSQYAHHHFHRSAKSAAPTIATTTDTIHSDDRVSRAGTTGTGLGGTSIAEGNSIFSAPNRSNQSLTTTLTTIRSTATSAAFAGGGGGGGQPSQPGQAFHPTFRGLHPHTYSTVTANNMLTDNASVLTLASSRRHRRNSLDTNASVRALPPSSLFSTSRESLPLMQSGHTLEGSAASLNAPSHHHRFASVHSTLLSPDRVSMSSQPMGETSSLRNSHLMTEYAA